MLVAVRRWSLAQVHKNDLTTTSTTTTTTTTTTFFPFQAVLSAIIVVALKGMFMQVGNLIPIINNSKKVLCIQ